MPPKLQKTKHAGQNLMPAWTAAQERIEDLWSKLQVALDVQEPVRALSVNQATPQALSALEDHLAELLVFQAETKRIISGWLDREKLIVFVQTTKALCLNDHRLNEIQDSLKQLDALSTDIVRAIGTWSRRFERFVVDAQRAQKKLDGKSRPRAVFVWGGRDGVERVQTDSEALARGEVLAVGRGGGGGPAADLITAAMREAGVEQRASAGQTERAKSHRCPPLVAQAAATQRYEVNNPLHEGPAPAWYSPTVAKAGIKAIKAQNMRRSNLNSSSFGDSLRYLP
jgi:hypothetical protein